MKLQSQESINTRKGVERCIRFAFGVCKRETKGKRVTLCGKTNVLTYAFDLWKELSMKWQKNIPI